VAEALGVSFQQVQKYEKGINRISAGTLHELWRLFDTPVQFFFDGSGAANKHVAAFDPLSHVGGTTDAGKVVTHLIGSIPECAGYSCSILKP
jgi:hypothetical protein